MASSRILYSQTTQLGKQLAQAVNAILEARAHVQRVLPILNAASYGNDWAALAAELGLPADAAGEAAAQTLWTIFATAAPSIDSAVVAELSRLDQG